MEALEQCVKSVVLVNIDVAFGQVNADYSRARKHFLFRLIV